MKKNIFLLALICIALMFPSCKTVKPFQKSRINDAEMSLSSRKIEKYESNFLLYREGASGGNGGKTGGGCGCN